MRRSFGYFTEPEWHSLMDAVVAECRRVLKPRGSAVFILQPNQESVGRMRPWLFEFQAKWAREWNMPQDVHWWNTAALPQTRNDPHRLRASLKACVWLGAPDCYHSADGVRWSETDNNKRDRLCARAGGGRPVEWEPESRVNRDRFRLASAADRNGGVTPYNVLPIPTSGSGRVRGGRHGAVTPAPVAEWWIQYTTRPGDVVCDPFCGVATVGHAAVRLGRSFVGIEKDTKYFRAAESALSPATEGVA